MRKRHRRYWLAAAGLAAGAGLFRVLAKAGNGADPARVGYLPLATPKSLVEGVWIVDDTIVAAGLSLPIRMTVLRLENGDLLLHSPTTYSPALAAALGAIGPVRHLVAPSMAHWTHLAEWQRACPEATTWSVPGLGKRAQVRASPVRIDHELGSVPPPWQSEIQQETVAGKGFRESWFFHRPSRTLVLCDLIQNLEPDKLPLATRLAVQAALATRGTTAAHVRATLMLAGPAAREQVRAMVALAPQRVVFAHGAIFETDAAERLRRAFAWLG